MTDHRKSLARLDPSHIADTAFDRGLEGLRGFACLLVVFAHMPEGIDPGYPYPTAIGQYLPVGLSGVLIFFLISGYVIGLVSRADYSTQGCRAFLWKRFVRLVPLYWLALAISVAVRPIDSIRIVMAQVFFLQNSEPYPGFRLSILKANFNFWSLNFEVLYYLTFLLVWRLRPNARNLGTMIFVMVALGFTGWIFPHQPKILTGYAVGGAYWYSGLWMVWYGKHIAANISHRLPWISILLLLEVTPHLRSLIFFMKSMGFAWPTDPKYPLVCLRDVELLPLGLIILAGVTRRELPLPRLIWTLALTPPLAFFAWNYAVHNQAVLNQNFSFLILLAAALVCLVVRFSASWWTWFCPIGLISYGIYILGRPMQYLVRYNASSFSGTWWTFAVRAAVELALILLIAYVAEATVQPRLRKWLNERFGARVTGIKSPVLNQGIH